MSGDCAVCGGGCSTCALPDNPVVGTRRVVLVGNPNVGKTTVFNRLTGLRQKVGNYSGVTVERKSGRLIGSGTVEIIDLPGTYSLNPKSLDEEIAYKVITGQFEGERSPDIIVCVLDATNLERNLFLVFQILELGVPVIIALNMIDAAEREGLQLDSKLLSAELCVPVVPVSAATGRGIHQLRASILAPLSTPAYTVHSALAEYDPHINKAASLLLENKSVEHPARAYGETLRAFSNQKILKTWETKNPRFYESILEETRALQQKGVDAHQIEAAIRFEQINKLTEKAVLQGSTNSGESWTDRIDSVLTHRIWGPIAFLLILLVVFQAVFSWATPAMDLIESGMGVLGVFLRSVVPSGFVQDLLVDGILAGVGSVLVFLPQILLLFFFIGLLEDTGYMARAAFISDRIMNRLGLSGRSIVPLVSGYACAVPAIMATRTIDNHRDRLVTMMVIPLMSCSARLPVYTLFIGAFIPTGYLFGVISFQGATLFGLYILSTLTALFAGFILKKFVLRGEASLLVLELPAYRIPQFRVVVWRMVERAKMFVTKAGKIILFMSIVLWFLASFPRIERPVSVQETTRDASFFSAVEPSPQEMWTEEDELASLQIRNSFIGKLGKAIEPVMRPLGFDWKISAGLISAFAAREVLVSTLATIYSVGDADETSIDLKQKLQADRNPETGLYVFTPLVAISLMIFIMLACQCMSTLAITRRETNSWRWPIFMFVYMTALAYVASLLVYQGGQLIGLA